MNVVKRDEQIQFRGNVEKDDEADLLPEKALQIFIKLEVYAICECYIGNELT